MKNAIVVGVLALCCGCGPFSKQLVFKQATPRAADCPLVLVHNSKLDGKPVKVQEGREYLGYLSARGNTLTPELKAEMTRRSCAMGGDTVSYDDVSHLSSDGLQFVVYRTLTPAEVEANLEATLVQNGASDAKLIEKAAFDHNCPAASVKILRKRGDERTGDYVLDVCGTEHRYTRLLYVFKPSDEVAPAPAPSP